MKTIALKYINCDIETYIVNTVNYFWFNNDKNLLNRLYEDEELVDFSYNELLEDFLLLYFQNHIENSDNLKDLLEIYGKKEKQPQSSEVFYED